MGKGTGTPVVPRTPSKSVTAGLGGSGVDANAFASTAVATTTAVASGNAPNEIAFIGSLAGNDSQYAGLMLARGAGGSVLMQAPQQSQSRRSSIASDEQPPATVPPVPCIQPSAAKAIADTWLIAVFNERNGENRVNFQCAWKPDVLHVEAWRCEGDGNVLKSCDMTDVVDGSLVSVCVAMLGYEVSDREVMLLLGVCAVGLLTVRGRGATLDRES